MVRGAAGEFLEARYKPRSHMHSIAGTADGPVLRNGRTIVISVGETQSGFVDRSWAAREHGGAR